MGRQKCKVLTREYSVLDGGTGRVRLLIYSRLPDTQSLLDLVSPLVSPLTSYNGFYIRELYLSLGFPVSDSG